jgi:hypothetical protein
MKEFRGMKWYLTGCGEFETLAFKTSTIQPMRPIPITDPHVKIQSYLTTESENNLTGCLSEVVDSIEQAIALQPVLPR